ncbi:formylglycine-generating enzyme family protein [Arthrobacter sp. NPDC055138]
MPPSLPQLVAVPAGSVLLRDARSESSREVSLARFRMSATQVTRAQHAAAFGSAEAVTGSPQQPAHPATWFEAVRWCNAASRQEGIDPAYTLRGREVHWDVSADGFRLPTEAEWEWACRAGTSGPAYGALPDIAWTAADHLEGPQEVGLKRPNNFGLFDTLGNVWEWCWDYADTARYADYRSLRGGGWSDRSWSCRASVRRASAPDAVLEDVGFRVARGAVGDKGSAAAQGWSAAADRARARAIWPLPVGWTPLVPLPPDDPDSGTVVGH